MLENVCLCLCFSRRCPTKQIFVNRHDKRNDSKWKSVCVFVCVYVVSPSRQWFLSYVTDLWCICYTTFLIIQYRQLIGLPKEHQRHNNIYTICIIVPFQVRTITEDNVQLQSWRWFYECAKLTSAHISPLNLDDIHLLAKMTHWYIDNSGKCKRAEKGAHRSFRADIIFIFCLEHWII